MIQGTPLEIVEKISAKTGSRYYSINVGTLGTIVVYPPSDDDKPVRCFLYARQPKDEAKPSATVVDLVHRPLDKPRATSAKPFYNDPLREGLKDGSAA